MPWVVKKVGEVYKLYNTDKKTFVNKNFKTRKSALATRKNYENYYKKKNDRATKHHKQQETIRNILPKNYKVLSWAIPMAWEALPSLAWGGEHFDVAHPTAHF